MDCTPQQQIDCGREFGRLAATLELVREDLAAVQSTLHEHSDRLADLRVHLASQSGRSRGTAKLAGTVTAIVAAATAASAAVWKGITAK